MVCRQKASACRRGGVEGDRAAEEDRPDRRFRRGDRGQQEVVDGKVLRRDGMAEQERDRGGMNGWAPLVGGENRSR